MNKSQSKIVNKFVEKLLDIYRTDPNYRKASLLKIHVLVPHATGSESPLLNSHSTKNTHKLLPQKEIYLYFYFFI